MRLFILVLSFFSATAGFAQTFEPKTTDRVLDSAAMSRDVVGRTHQFFDGGISFYSVSGTYTYTYSDGGRAYGTYQLSEDGANGVVCSAFANGFSRCDMYVHDGTRLVLITEQGDRFPVKAVH